MFRFEYYDDLKEAEWEDFIEEKSVNGTFLQSRRFLNYHEKGKFQDVSLMVYNEKQKLAAVIPACEIIDGNKKVFYSHKGTTFGGIIVDKKNYNAKCLMNMIQELKIFLKAHGYKEVYLKQTPDIFSLERSDLFQYIYVYNGFMEYKELSTYIDFNTYGEDVLRNFAQGKRTNVHNCVRENLLFKHLDRSEEIATFHNILSENLNKHGLKPVHTIDELLDFKNMRLKKECEFFGVFKGEEMLAGAMMFYFPRFSCAHTQYLAARQAYNKLSPMTFLYYSVILEMKKRGYAKLSWGIATEEMGKVLNMGLISSKEAYRSSYSNNLTYYYDLEK